MKVEETDRQTVAGARPLVLTHIKSILTGGRWGAPLSIGLMICVSLIEGFGLTMLLPLLQLIGLEIGAEGGKRVAGVFYACLDALSLKPTLLTVLLCFIAITMLEALLAYLQANVTSKLVHGYTVSLRRRLYQSVANVDWLYFSRRRSSDFLHALTEEIDRIEGATYALLALASGCLLTLIYVVLAVRLSPMLSALVFVSGGLLMLLLRPRLRVAAATGERLSSVYSDLVATTTEHLGAMRTSRSYGASHRNQSFFDALAGRLAKVYVDSDRNHAISAFIFSVGSVIVLAVTVYTAFEILAVPAAYVLMLIFLFSRTMPRLSGIQRYYQSYLNMLPAFARVKEMQEACVAAKEPWIANAEAVGFSQSIQLRDVAFSYDRGVTPVVSGLTLSIRAGRTTAIVGPSGAGKSTIADLIMGLISPAQGELLVDDERLTPERILCWRGCIGYVNQDTFLFHDTVRANLLWACPEATDEELHHALKLAAADRFIAALPQGIETVIGDRGVLISGGEKQRIALARALLRKPLLLILDEATSALDPENERRIDRALEALHGAMAILIITHHLANVRHADAIYFIDQGQLVEQGNWDELVAAENGRLRSFGSAR